IRVLPVQVVGDHQPEHRVAEKLQSLVRRKPAVLVGVRPVRQGEGQQLAVDLDTECFEQGCGISCRSGWRLTPHTDDLMQARQPDGRRTGHTSGTRRAAASTAGTRGSGRAPTAPGSPSTASGASECWNATSSAWGRPRLRLLTQVCSRSASGLANTSKDYLPVGAARRVATRSLLQALHQRGPPRVYGLMPVSGLEFGPFHTATGAQ